MVPDKGHHDDQWALEAYPVDLATILEPAIINGHVGRVDEAHDTEQRVVLRQRKSGLFYGGPVGSIATRFKAARTAHSGRYATKALTGTGVNDQIQGGSGTEARGVELFDLSDLLPISAHNPASWRIGFLGNFALRDGACVAHFEGSVTVGDGWPLLAG